MKTVSVEVIRILLILLFAYTAAAKLLEYSKLVTQLHDSPLLPAWTANLAWSIPVSEILAVVCLIFAATQRMGFYLSSILMLSFTLYVIAILTMADYVPCSCGGVIELLSWRGHLVLNSVFLVLSVVGIMWSGRSVVGQNQSSFAGRYGAS